MNIELLTTEEVCSFFKVTSKTIYNWRKNEDIAFPKPVFIGGTNLYKRSEIEAFIESLYSQIA